MDVPCGNTNPNGEEEVITLASFSGFLGTVWFMLLLAGVSFCAGMAFKEQVISFFTKLKGK